MTVRHSQLLRYAQKFKCPTDSVLHCSKFQSAQGYTFNWFRIVTIHINISEYWRHITSRIKVNTYGLTMYFTVPVTASLKTAVTHQNQAYVYE
jgi:hypothetical protein